MFPPETFNGWQAFDYTKEFERQGINWGKWRMSKINKDYHICEHYPKDICIPTAITDESVLKVLNFH